MKKSDFYFDLPEELIAQSPLSKRDDSRLLTLDIETGDVDHDRFYNIIKYIRKGDCLILNNSRVIPARLFGIREDTKYPVEIVLLKDKGENVWECLVRPGKKIRMGTKLSFGEGLLKANVIGIDDEGGNRFIKFTYEGIFLELLEKLGTMPLPPYIKEKLQDPERYQTIYSKHNGSAAAPTAGLHFTEQLLAEIAEKGVNIAYVTLHVGLGTFRPVKEEDILNHKMHSEHFFITEENAKIINESKKNGGRIFAVGTTALRTVESACDEQGKIMILSKDTDIFIYPGYDFKIVDCLITNFHLPESTLMMLISAFAGRDQIMNAYEKAIEEKYRFFSFGDSMLLYRKEKDV